MANVLERTVAAGTDDAEERATGRMALPSTDLDFFNDRYGSGGVGQQVGIRFTGIDIPPGAVITSAYLQFHTDEKGSTETSLLIRGEGADDAAGFLDVDHNISSRQTTEASTTWTAEPWSDLGESSGAQSTPDLSSIVQEIVARPGWESGNDLAFIISGSGSRTAEASEGVPGRAPQLHIEWIAGDAPPTGGTDKTAPTVVMEGPEDGSQVSGVITLSADASDNVGVTGVQFFLDGNSVGALDTSEPYGVKVDTTKFSDGTVALLAVATDAAGNTTTSAPVTVTVDNGGSEPPPPPPPASGTIRVPQDYATIQKAVNAAGDGDTIVVGPGTYSGDIVISGKSITLISLYQATGDPSLVDDTIIKGGSPGIRVDESAPNTTIAGFHFMGGKYGVKFHAQGGRCLDNFFDDTGSDAISFEDVGGVARGNRIVGAGDDGIDVDAASANVLIENNTISQAGDDGIEIRNQNYHGALVTHTIRGNTITGSEEDGIQLIDYSQLSDRAFVIQDNVIRGSADVGLGIMDNGETREDFRGASMPERVTVSSNVFDGNRYGITGGDNLTATGNTISNSEVGLKNVDGQSTVTGTRFINNDVNYIHSNVVGSASATSAESLALNDLVDVPDDSGILTVGAPAGGQQGAGGSSTTTIGLNASSQVEQPVDAASPASP